MGIYSGHYFLQSNTVILLSLFSYLIQALIYYKLAEKAKLEYKWLAFIPILQFILFFHMIDRSAVYVLFGLLGCIPFVGPFIMLILRIYWKVKFYRAFGIDKVLIAFAVIIPFVDFILELYMAFCDSVQYKIKNKYQVY